MASLIISRTLLIYNLLSFLILTSFWFDVVGVWISSHSGTTLLISSIACLSYSIWLLTLLFLTWWLELCLLELALWYVLHQRIQWNYVFACELVTNLLCQRLHCLYSLWQQLILDLLLSLLISLLLLHLIFIDNPGCRFWYPKHSHDFFDLLFNLILLWWWLLLLQFLLSLIQSCPNER